MWSKDLSYSPLWVGKSYNNSDALNIPYVNSCITIEYILKNFYMTVQRWMKEKLDSQPYMYEYINWMYRFDSISQSNGTVM